MSDPIEYLAQLHSRLKSSRHREAVILDGCYEWRISIVKKYLSTTDVAGATKLGGEGIHNIELLGYKSGHQLLGRERDLLIYDDSDGFDANSFTAAIGCLVGGGIVFLFVNDHGAAQLPWLVDAFSELTTISEDGSIVQSSKLNETVQESIPSYEDQYAEQGLAVDKILRVLDGHRKRPLVLTADRGRGKSSALGIAAAKLMSQKGKKVLVTAPARKSVEPVFEHAERLLTNSFEKNKNRIVMGEASLSFISPDELLLTKPDCDILFVDEASAIPLPMLKASVEIYHRVVFSTTVHGYEGCGRGFTIKFSEWLDKNRPGWNSFELKTPIRWGTNDPLENWLFDTFLLDAEIEPVNRELCVQDADLSVKLISKSEMFESKDVVRDSFALLVSAHYQTSPNDLLQLLEDESTHLITINKGDKLLGCLLVHLEGGMSRALLEDVLSGTRRPRGHLIASTLATQLGIEQAALDKCLRIMRVAVHPDLHRSGIGSKALSKLDDIQELEFDYVATSFGVTSELINFWRSSEFLPVRLGAKRDQASGTHSLIMVRASTEQPWINEVAAQFPEQLISLMPEVFSETESALLSDILASSSANHSYQPTHNVKLIQNYCFGAVSYESIFWELYKAICLQVIKSNKKIPPILLAKLFQRMSWKRLVSSFGHIGRKQVEEQLKKEAAIYLDLQCKTK
ncbi:GNAT family N-acetyltransferase [Vibrio sp. HN007]|uniref:GNAT family N-acetyltransferase n=1 Tax=Vibrio iocasae TaxID=3098914 RepID=UPI0035D44CAC